MLIQADSFADKQITGGGDDSFRWDDPRDLDGELSGDERMVRDTARAFAQDRLMPRVLQAYRDERADRDLLPQMGELGLLGATLLEEYGGVGLNYVAYGLIAREIERVDSGYRSMLSVQSSPGSRATCTAPTASPTSFTSCACCRTWKRSTPTRARTISMLSFSAARRPESRRSVEREVMAFSMAPNHTQSKP